MGDRCSIEENKTGSDLKNTKNGSGSVRIPGTHKRIKTIERDTSFPFVKASHQLESVMPLFIKKNVLGRGASCEVCAVERKADGKEFAMKIMKRQDQWNTKLFKQEHNVLSRLNHRNIVEYHDYYIDKTNFYFCMELCKGGELFNKIKELKKFSEMHAAQIIRTILHVIAHCHSNDVVHRDLKPENLVFRTKAQRELVLIDFGDSRIVQENECYEDFVGTAFYLAPECIRKRTGDELKKSDVWTIGVITWIMLVGRPPFVAEDNSKLLSKIIKDALVFPKKPILSKVAKDFLQKMLSKKPEERLSAKQALEHDWLKGRAGTVHLGQELLESLSNYTRASKLKRVLVRMMEHQMTSLDKKEVRLQFDKMDTNGDGKINVEEMANFIHKMGGTREEAMQTATAIMSQIDQDGDKMISLSEWQDAKISTKFQDEKLIKQHFNKIDINGDGFISQSELTQFFHGKLDPKVVKLMIEEVDTNNDGEISYDEFEKAMKGGCLKNVVSPNEVAISEEIVIKDFDDFKHYQTPL